MQSLSMSQYGKLERSLDWESENLVVWFIVILASYYLSLKLLELHVAQVQKEIDEIRGFLGYLLSSATFLSS